MSDMHQIEVAIASRDLRRWAAGEMSPEEADIFEVGLALLQLSRERARSRRDDPTLPLSAPSAA